MQTVLIQWQQLFADQDYNYDDVMAYAGMLAVVEKLAQSLNITDLVHEVEQIQEFKTNYYEIYTELYLLIVKKSKDVDGCTTLIEMLDMYGVKLNHTLCTMIKSYVFLPGDDSLAFKHQFQHNLSQVHRQLEVEPEAVLLLKQSVTLKILIELLTEMKTFLDPILDKVDFFVYFNLHNCEVFGKYLKYQLDMISSSQCPVKESDVHATFISAQSQEYFAEPDKNIVQFGDALKNTEDFMLSLIEGRAKYEEIVAEQSIGELLPKLDVDEEFKIMCGFPKFQKVSSENKEGKEGIKNMLELFQCSQQIALIPKVCEQYGLANCVNDENLRNLMEIANTVNSSKYRGSITGKDATENMKRIWEMLNLKDYSEAKRCLKIFPAVANCIEFYKFVKGKGFTSETESRSTFRNQIGLITAQLQHEAYNETVLNHILPAFQYIVPFLDAYQSFKDLMAKIAKLFNDGVGFGRDSSKDYCQLETVNSNITMIQLWFSRTEGDTVENVSKELECIMNSGYFELVIAPCKINEVSLMKTDVNSSCKVLLYYEPIKELRDRKNRVRGTSESCTTDISVVPCSQEIWNREQIDDFVRKLGFLETQKVDQPMNPDLEAQKSEQQVKTFQQLNQTAQTLYNTMLKLRNLGHQDYVKITETVQCNGKLENALEKVSSAENKLKKWRIKISNLYKDYNELLFFSVSKILSIHEILRNFFSVDKVLQEIGFLFKNDDEAMNSLRVAVESSRDGTVTNDGKQLNEVPVEYVGKYLQCLCNDKSVKKYFLYSRSQPSKLVEGKKLLPFQEVVHFVPNYDNGQLLRLLIEIYNGVPESYEVFHCSEDSTEDDLKLFLHRASKFKHHTFTILEVNKLPDRLQEVILHHHSHGVKELESFAHLNYIETNDSVLHEMPWVVVKEYKENGPNYEWPKAKSICEKLVYNTSTNFTLELVYGCAGDGKSHYIKKQLRPLDHYQIVAVNEAFSVLNTIYKLRMLPPDHNCAIYFNFTVIPPVEGTTCATPEEETKYNTLMDTLAWFFFKLLVFGYVEDIETGIAFQLRGGLHWKIFVEIPSLLQEDAKFCLDFFQKKIPVFNIIGKPFLIDKARLYDIDRSVQLVCKYLRAYDNRNDIKIGINKLYTRIPVKFGDDLDLTEKECYDIFGRHMPTHVTTNKVLQQLFIKYMERRCKFLEQFPAFNFNHGYGLPIDSKKETPDQLRRMVDNGMLKKISSVYYTNTSKLGEVLMETMLKEVSEFCKPDVQQNWAAQEHQQLIYEVTEEAGSIHLITLKPDSLPKDQAMKYKILGIEIPSLKKLLKRNQYDSYLSYALGVPLIDYNNPPNEDNKPGNEGNEKPDDNNKDERLKDIDEAHYVLTLDYTMKMLNIHERRQCGIPVIIEGETGVGKTALINMLSKLWNHALINEWRTVKGRIVWELYQKSHELENNDLKNSLKQLHTNGWHFDKQSQSQTRNLCEKDLEPLLKHKSQQSDTQYFKFMNEYLLQLINTVPILELVEIEATSGESQPKGDSAVVKLIKQSDRDSSAQATAKMLCTLLNGSLVATFYKLNIHAALTPKKIQEFFAPIIKLAINLKNRASKLQKSGQPPQEPLIAVFLDELNTSSCMGLFKEMIVDKSFEGDPLPSNIFLVAACNPHRGNSLDVHGFREDLEVPEHNGQQDGSKVEVWFRGSYYVQKLHPTLKFLMWNYGSLNDEQEADYIKEKMKMVNTEFDKIQNIAFSELVVECQRLMRQFACEQLRRLGINESDAKLRASSCVSQRDIQRVFTFYCWIIKVYKNLKPSTEEVPVEEDKTIKYADVESLEVKQKALLVALGLVYYMRLGTKYRLKFVEKMDQLTASYSVKFKKAFSDEMGFYINKLSLPTGIAKTEALKENLFATIICTVTNTPLIIVGAPGSSKTLSFNLTVSNLKGPESKETLFRKTEVFKSLDPHYYQCSRRTTSTEIETVFRRAIKRQRSHDGFSMPIRCVVFMDEAGLPEESHESLKVLHYHLDQREVAFVGITNHVLDAAKTNRAVSLFRPIALQEHLEELAKGCLSSSPNGALPDFDVKAVENFCAVYYKIMQEKRFNTFFGLRDFIHFINYLRRKRQGSMTPKLILQSLERNFNGTDNFEYICTLFLGQMDNDLKDNERTIVDILHNSLADKPFSTQTTQTTQTKLRSLLDDTQNEVRYKLIIDPSEDESITRLLFMFDILKREKTCTFMCSDFPGDSQLQKINTIAAIRHSAVEGHTVIMSQTDDIHESFYDLFNQHFRRIDDPKRGPRYFTNIAIGAFTKPSRVDQEFQCIVVIKESEIKNTPAPFLNRFEKYSLSHTNLLDLVLDALPPCLKVIVNSAKKKVESFYSLVEKSALYGAANSTVCSLLLTVLPRPRHKYKEALQSYTTDDNAKHSSKATQLLNLLQKSLHEMGGFCYTEGIAEELEHDAKSIVQLLANAGSKFSKAAKALEDYSLSEISQWVSEAMQLAYEGAPPPDINCEDYGKLGASDEVCMVITLITQWLVRFMCKKLMQLMTPEALILKRKSIPRSYLETYLKFQSHFSIKDLIAEKIQMLDECDGDKIATKLICYTRSSSLVHQLPIVYPRSTVSTPENETSKQYIEAVIYEKAECVFLCKLSSISSQTSFKLQLQSFKDSSQQTVFVLVVNMKETKCQIINHIRIMIEEVDFSNGNFKKLFVLLLHFPPTMFYEPCYPALFLYGWDHHYLDTVGHFNQFPLKDDQPKEVSIVDIREWFTQSCLTTQEAPPVPIKDDSMCKLLLQLLKESESIQVIASRILLTVDSSKLSLENAPDIVSKYTYLRELLIDKNVGGVLCSKFRSYWKPSVIGNHLEQAARFCKSRESTLSISDSVDSVCKTAFFNFVAYMIYQVSKSHNLQLLFSSHCDDATLDLFLKLLNAHPIPELPEIKAYSNTLDCRIHTISKSTSIPQFPFFRDVSAYINNLIQHNVDESNKSVFILQENEPRETTTSLLTEEQMFNNLYNSVCTEIEALKKDGENHITEVAILEMQSSEEIWKKYYNDFVNQYLHLSGAPDDIEHKLLQITLSGVLDNYKEMKAVALHCYIHLYQLDIAKVVALLKPLAQIKHKVVRCEDSIYPADPQESLFATAQASKSLQSSIISKYVVDSLFVSLIDILYHKGKKMSLLQEWYKSYRDLVNSMQKSALTAVLKDQYLKAKYHLIQTTFVILQLFDHVTDVTADCACVIATYFCQKIFSNEFQLKEDHFLNLESMVGSVELVQGSQYSHIVENQLYHCITDGLYMQFFPESMKENTEEEPYNQEDVVFFMKFANGEVPLVQDIPTQLKKTDDNYYDCISLSKFKSYLDKILSRGWSKDRRTLKPLNLYKYEVCTCIGETILIQYAETIPDDLRYVPLYLQQTLDTKQSSSVMQEKLAHLYFYTVLERLQTLQYTPSDLISFIHTIDKMKHVSNAERVISVIERQALIEVLLKVIVDRFHKDDKAEMKTLLEISDEINALVTNQSYYDIMLMHLIKKYHGPRGVLNAYSEEKERLSNFECFKYVQKTLQNSSAATSHLFPFIVSSSKAKHQFTSLYKEICNNLDIISKGYSPAKQRKFLTYVNSVIRSSDRSYDKVSCIRMMIWLCVYHEFYCKKKQSHELVLLFENCKEDLKLSNEHIKVLNCFLDSTKMIKKEEVSNPLNPDAVIYEETRTGEVQRITPSGNVDKRDAIWEFFNPYHDEDPSDTDLRHALANMIAVVFALPSRSNHIWYHMFRPGKLENTHLTGFMYPYTVKTGGLMYDCGCELNQDGQYGRKDYIPHATRGTLSLHSWYLMLWTNFGAFCVGLLTQPNAIKQISGHILSDQMSIREYCMTQLKTVWLHMRTNFVCSDDERSFFIMKSMYTLLMLYQDGKLTFSKGRFDDIESLDTYEKTWHTSIYAPSKANLQVELENHSSDSMWMLPALKKYRILNQQYPHLATENEYMKSLVAARETHDLNDEHLFVLHRFTLEHDRLQLGGALLPDLVEFYQWIHTHLSHLVTYERAQEITIGDVIKLSAKRYPPKLHERLTSLYHNFSKKYNNYIKINGGAIGEATCDRTAKPTDAQPIDDDTRLINFLSHESEDITKYDWLHIVLMDVIDNHNSFLISLYEQSKSSKCHYQRYLADSPPELYATEVTRQNCIIPSDGDTGRQQFLKLIKSCYMYSGVQSSPLFDLEQLEQSVVTFYIAGKPRIQLGSIRTIFRFRNSPNVTTLGNSPGCAIDVSSVAQELPSEFKELLLEETRQSLVHHFHTATFQVLDEVSTGLRNVLGHLSQDILQQKGVESLLNDNLGSFLKRHFDSNNLQQVFYQIGIQSINVEQLTSFEGIELKRLYNCLVLFVEWLQGGLYDFSKLPVTVFKHMRSEDQELIQQFNEEYSSKENLLNDLDQFEKILNQAEKYLTTEADPRKPLIENMVDISICEETDSFVALVPQSVLTYHYVYFRMTLRKLKLKVTMMTDSQPQESSTAPTKWSEIIEDLWKYLPHFQDEEQLYDEDCLKFDCVKLQFGDGEESDSDDTPWVLCDLSSIKDSTDGHVTNSVSQIETSSVLQKIEDNPEIKEAVMHRLFSSSTAVPIASSTMSLPDPSETAKNMTTDQLCEWLKSIDIDDEYIQCFKKAHIKGRTLVFFTENELEEIGVSLSYVRKQILVEFRNIK